MAGRASKMLVSALPLGFFGSRPRASRLQGEGKTLEPGPSLDRPHRVSSPTLRSSRCRPSPAALTASLLQPQPGQALAAMHSRRASPIYHKETGAGRDLGPDSAVPSSFKQGEVGWPGGMSQAKQTSGAPSGIGSRLHQLCGRLGLGNAKSATFSASSLQDRQQVTTQGRKEEAATQRASPCRTT